MAVVTITDKEISQSLGNLTQDPPAEEEAEIEQTHNLRPSNQRLAVRFYH